MMIPEDLAITVLSRFDAQYAQGEMNNLHFPLVRSTRQSLGETVKLDTRVYVSKAATGGFFTVVFW